MSLNHRPADESCENVQLRPFKPPDDETRRLSEADQLRAELKAETGYESYIEYLGAHEELREHFSKLQRDLFTKEMFKSTCFILDLSRGVDSQANVSLRYRTSSPAEVLTNLRHPPAESSVQVLLWMVNGVSPDLVSALGLGLNIDPSFFEAVHQRVLSREQRRESIDQSTFEAVPQRVKSPPYGHERPFAPSYAEIGGSIVTTTVSHRSGQPHPVLVVFIAGTDCNFVQIATKIGGLLPLPGNAADKTSYELWDQPQWLQHKDNVGGYAAILHWCLGNENKATDNNINLIFVALLPLAYITALRIHDQCGRTRIFYLKVLKPSPIVPRPSPLDGDYREDKNWVISQLHWNRLLLRRLAEDLEDESEDLIRYLKWQALTDWPPAYSKIAECYQRAHKSAHRMEAEIRDFLQLQAGEMGLQESRKSIEISSLQIEESKRGSFLIAHCLFVSH